jgi:hypothetical protein
MKFAGALVAVSLVFASASAAAPSHLPKIEQFARETFAKHDRHGRFKYTRISKLGDVHVGRHVYAIYNLFHVNEVTGSGHGMQQVSIIRDGRVFVGSYLDVSEPMAQIRGRTVFQKRDEYMKRGDARFSFTIGPKGPPRKVLLGGQFQTLEHSI